MKASTGIFLDKRRKLKDETYPVKLRVTYERKSKLYKTIFSFSEVDFNKTMGKSPRGDFKDFRIELNDIEAEAAGILDKLNAFSFDDFEKRYLNKNTDVSNIFELFKVKMSELESENRIGTLNTYQYALKSFKKFHPAKRLETHEITVKLLNDYEKWMLNKGRSLTSIGIYLRCLRAIYNISIEQNQLTGLSSPFGKKKYKIPEPRNIKKALTIGEIKLLFNYKAQDGSPEQMYKDLWFFSYLCNGMNMKDICLIQHKNIDGNHIYFFREKTINSNRDSKPIDVIIINEIREILNRWASKADSQEDFIFPFITNEMDARKVIATVKQVTKMTNKYIWQIAKKVGINKKITTYWARHSYATVLKRSNVGMAFISEQLGHRNLKTTESYLDSFEDDTKMEIANKLLEF